MFTAAIVYLIILDQLGNIFIDPNLISKIQRNEGAIKVALKSFSQLSCKDRSTISALRNGLAHNFSLCGSEGRFNKKNYYHFSLIYTEEHKTLINSREQWDGTPQKKSEANETEIGLHSLCDLVEGVIHIIKMKIDHDLIKLRIGLAEIKMRFTIL